MKGIRNKLLILLIVVLAVFLVGCKKPNPVPTPTPQPTLPVDYISIPDWLDTPVEINHWYRQLGAKWTSDEVTTGYTDYRFTPVEFTLAKIPDVNKPGKYIEKTPYMGDCDDLAKFSGYIAYVKFHCNSHIIHFLIGGNIHLGHAITYGIIEGQYHFWDNEYYRGGWDSVEAFMEAKYPGYIIYSHKPLKDILEELFNEGHLEYAPVEARKAPSKKKACEDETCPIN